MKAGKTGGKFSLKVKNSYLMSKEIISDEEHQLIIKQEHIMKTKELRKNWKDWRVGITLQNERDKIFWDTDIISGGIRIARVTGVGREQSISNAEFIVHLPKLLLLGEWALSELNKGMMVPDSNTVEGERYWDKINELTQIINQLSNYYGKIKS